MSKTCSPLTHNSLSAERTAPRRLGPRVRRKIFQAHSDLLEWTDCTGRLLYKHIYFICMNVCMYVCIYSYKHTHTQTHTHSLSLSLSHTHTLNRQKRQHSKHKHHKVCWHCRTACTPRYSVYLHYWYKSTNTGYSRFCSKNATNA